MCNNIDELTSDSSHINLPILSVSWSPNDIIKLTKELCDKDITVGEAADILEEEMDLLEKVMINSGVALLEYSILKRYKT